MLNKAIKGIVIGEPCNPPKHFNCYEVWLEFDHSEEECEIVFPDKILERLRSWHSVSKFNGPLAQSIMALEGYDFLWPSREDREHTVRISGVYYYDVHGRKHSVTLEYED